MLSLDLLGWALVAGLAVGISAPAVGFFLVERRMSLVGDAVGHTAFAGVAIGLFLGVDPVWAALVTAVLGAAAVEWLRASGRAAGDQVLALLLYSGMSVGIVVASAARAANANLFAYLFGSLLTVTPAEVGRLGLLALFVLLVLGLFFRPLLAVALDEQGARASGLEVGRWNVLLAVLAAATITGAMRAVGLLLVAALMVLPVSAAGVLAWSVRSTLWIAMALGASSVLVGLLVASAADLAPGGTIVLVAAATYALLLLMRAVRKSRRRG